MQKKFGQNFLINGDARRRLVDALGLSPGDAVWEVGPGLGAMTAELLSRGAAVTAFEIDRGFIAALKELFSGAPLFQLVEGDALRTCAAEAEKNRAGFFFGNLPYNIAATLIGDLLAAGILFQRQVVTVQREVARRMAAKVGSADYSGFSVLCASAYRISGLSVLKGANFYPVPQVDSQGVLLELRGDADPSAYPALFRPLVRALFSSRRKTIRNNLGALIAGRCGPGASAQDLAAAALDSAGLDGALRAERLEVGDFLRLAAELEKLL